MSDQPADDFTHLLRSLDLGDESASAKVFEQVYDELRRLASACFRPGNSPTLQPTALVHESWLKLEGKLSGIRDRGHFLALAGLAMRQILADRARAARAQHRDAKRVSVILDAPSTQHSMDPLDIVALDDALTKLATLKERHARVVELRFLAGLTIAETAQAIGVSHTTIESDWVMAQAWLRTELERA